MLFQAIALVLPIVISSLIVLAVMPYWIRKAREIGLEWDDMNKPRRKRVAGSGGVVVVGAFLTGALVYVGINVFLSPTQKNPDFLVEIFAALLSISMLAAIGFVDDLFGWLHGGLSKRSRIILVTLASIPLVAIQAGESGINLPLIGPVQLGVLYPLLLVPLGIVGASTTYNFLAGFNGLEAGLGVLLTLALAVVSFLTHNTWLGVLNLIMLFSLLAFLVYNFYPAKVFPGDALTYSVGGLIAISAILGNFEKIAVAFFTPFIIETILKLRGKLKAYSFGMPQKDGTLKLRYKQIYSLNHLAIYAMQKLGVKPTEKRVVYCVWAFQAIIIALSFAIFSAQLR